jgi:3-oxoacyl-[acyl-carrier-protein] synthase II
MSDIVLSGWSAVSPYGLGADDLSTGLAAGDCAVRPMVSGVDGGPYPRAALIPDFDVKQVLGRKGTRAMDRVTALTVATVGAVLSAHGDDASGEQQSMALVLGTSSGSYQSIIDFTLSSLTGDRPYLVDPAQFPNTVMNRAAGQSAIWYGLKGPNATVSGGRLAGLLALNYAQRLCRRGRAETVLCGAVEEFSTERSWIDWHAAGRPDPAVSAAPGEGCAMFVVESGAVADRAGRTRLADVAGLGFAAFHPGMDPAQALADCVRSTLDRNGASAADIALVAPNGTAGPLAAPERAAVDAVLGRGDWAEVPTSPLLGDLSAASAAFQIAAVLAAAARVVADGDARADGATTATGLVLVTSMDPAGTVGCALLRVPVSGPNHSSSRQPQQKETVA